MAPRKLLLSLQKGAATLKAARWPSKIRDPGPFIDFSEQSLAMAATLKVKRPKADAGKKKISPPSKNAMWDAKSLVYKIGDKFEAKS